MHHKPQQMLLVLNKHYSKNNAEHDGHVHTLAASCIQILDVNVYRVAPPPGGGGYYKCAPFTVLNITPREGTLLVKLTSRLGSHKGF